MDKACHGKVTYTLSVSMSKALARAFSISTTVAWVALSRTQGLVLADVHEDKCKSAILWVISSSVGLPTVYSSALHVMTSMTVPHRTLECCKGQTWFFPVSTHAGSAALTGCRCKADRTTIHWGTSCRTLFYQQEIGLPFMTL